LIKVVDNTGLTGNIDALTAETLAEAGENYAFRGVAFAPGSSGVITPIQNVKSANGVVVYSNNSGITINNAIGQSYKIVDITGILISEGVCNSSEQAVQINKSGIFIVKVGNKAFKVLNTK